MPRSSIVIKDYKSISRLRISTKRLGQTKDIQTKLYFLLKRTVGDIDYLKCKSHFEIPLQSNKYIYSMIMIEN